MTWAPLHKSVWTAKHGVKRCFPASAPCTDQARLTMLIVVPKPKVGELYRHSR